MLDFGDVVCPFFTYIVTTVCSTYVASDEERRKHQRYKNISVFQRLCSISHLTPLSPPSRITTLLARTPSFTFFFPRCFSSSSFHCKTSRSITLDHLLTGGVGRCKHGRSEFQVFVLFRKHLLIMICIPWRLWLTHIRVKTRIKRARKDIPSALRNCENLSSTSWNNISVLTPFFLDTQP
jgi:hypothetical protein